MLEHPKHPSGYVTAMDGQTIQTQVHVHPTHLLRLAPIRPLLMTSMFLLLINSLEDEGGRMRMSLFHYFITNLALKNPQKCMNTNSFFSELVPGLN